MGDERIMMMNLKVYQETFINQMKCNYLDFGLSGDITTTCAHVTDTMRVHRNLSLLNLINFRHRRQEESVIDQSASLSYAWKSKSLTRIFHFRKTIGNGTTSQQSQSGNGIS